MEWLSDGSTFAVENLDTNETITIVPQKDGDNISFHISDDIGTKEVGHLKYLNNPNRMNTICVFSSPNEKYIPTSLIHDLEK